MSTLWLFPDISGKIQYLYETCNVVYHCRILYCIHNVNFQILHPPSIE